MWRLCRNLRVSRSGYYQWRVRLSGRQQAANEVLDTQVKIVYRLSERTYGRLRIVRVLREEHNLKVGHERVRQILLRQGLAPVYKRPYVKTTDSNHTQPLAPNVLNRRFTGWGLDQAWVGDITYIPTEVNNTPVQTTAGCSRSLR